MSLKSYEDILKVLIKYRRPEGKPGTASRLHGPELLEKSKRFFFRCGHKLEELSKLNAIHVTGTKGKGSVSAFCESILRRYGVKTGIVTSPHLIDVRERIRINGQPLTQDQFANYFWECFERLESSKANDEDMPSYYRLFSLLAFHIFLQEGVDVAVIEVGQGGAFDTTNLLINPLACGVTLMDMDHTDTLGDTLEKITWHKAGIAKPGSPMVIYPQKPGPLKVTYERAKEIGASSLEIAPDLAEYCPKRIAIGIKGEHNKLNASLAAQLCRKWLVAKGMWDGQSQSQDIGEEENGTNGQVPYAQPFELPEKFLLGLKLCFWPGRAQIEKRDGVTFYFDAAHTSLSAKACAKWFQDEADKETKTFRPSSRVIRVLLFNFLHNFRDRYDLLVPLSDYEFDYAVFAPCFSGGDGTNTLEQTNLLDNQAALNKVSSMDEQVWHELNTQKKLVNGNSTSKPVKTKVFPSIDHAIEWICRGRGLSVTSTAPEMLSEVDSTPDDLTSATHIQVLVTGNTKLVGIAMYVLGMSAFSR